MRAPRAIVPFLLLLTVATGCQDECVPEGGIYSGHDRGAHCCSGLVSYNIVVPSDDYEGTDLPEGCGVGEAGADMLVCIACGDGMCGTAENFCNCPEDCPRE